MEGPNFDPVVGEEVRVGGNAFPGIFTIIGVQPSNLTSVPEGWVNNFMGAEVGRTVNLKRVGNDSFVPNVPWTWLQYVDETRPVHRIIEWLKTNPDPAHPYPDYVAGYEVETGEDHEGSPAFFIRFIVDPDYFNHDGTSSDARIGELNQFLQRVRTELLELSLDRWPYVRVLEKRRLLDVAS